MPAMLLCQVCISFFQNVIIRTQTLYKVFPGLSTQILFNFCEEIRIKNLKKVRCYFFYVHMHNSLGFFYHEEVLHHFQEARSDKFKEVLQVIFHPKPKSDSLPPAPGKIIDDSNFLIRLSPYE